MATTVIDELVTIIRYNTSNRELRRAEQQVNDFTRNTQRQFASWGQTINKITRAATVVLGALGAGAFKVDSFVERPVRDGPWSARVSGREAPRAVGC